MVEVLGTAEFEEWFLGLGSPDARAIVRGVGLLEAKGLALGFPHCSALEGCRHALRELRVQSSGRPLRIVYAFDRPDPGRRQDGGRSVLLADDPEGGGDLGTLLDGTSLKLGTRSAEGVQ